jgi:hypothetical protein
MEKINLKFKRKLEEINSKYNIKKDEFMLTSVI